MNRHLGLFHRTRLACVALVLWSVTGNAQRVSYPNNATTCEQCHSVPARFGSSQLAVQRAGRWEDGKYVPVVEGGIVHRHGASTQSAIRERDRG